jgi:hypothetical protein
VSVGPPPVKIPPGIGGNGNGGDHTTAPPAPTTVASSGSGVKLPQGKGGNSDSNPPASQPPAPLSTPQASTAANTETVVTQQVHTNGFTAVTAIPTHVQQQTTALATQRFVQIVSFLFHP